MSITTRTKSKKILGPIEKLKKRIAREFQKKKYIGDISITDEEYALLVKYAIVTFNNILTKYNHTILDTTFATALVQIGIKHYDGNYWSNFAQELNIKKIQSYQQTWVGDSFISTIKSYNKISLGDNEKVGTILMHGFVSDKYSRRFFDFLYKYYTLDLERDIEKLDTQAVNSLVEVMIRNDNRDRTSMLVNQTADALKFNVRGSKNRIRRWIKLIDKCFWDREVPTNLNNRFNKYFVNWSESSEEFSNDYKNIYSGNGPKKPKSFSIPYLMCNFHDASFKLVLPKQLIKREETDYVYWIIKMGDDDLTIDSELYEAITGYKTEEQEVYIEEKKYLFNEIIIELKNGDKRIRKFKIDQDCIRFFNTDGIHIKTDTLGEGNLYSFSNKAVVTDALIESQISNGMIFSYYEFQRGGIIRLPDNKVICIGRKIEEGLIQRGLLDKAYLSNNNENLAIYNNVPSILIKIKESKVNGTLININGEINRLANIESTILDLKDGSQEVGHLIKLSDFACKADGVYEVYIDVPNDRANRHWKFALIKNFNFKFDGSPYIFKTKGTISFNDEVKVIPIEKSITKITGENSYAFPITPDNLSLKFNININNNIYTTLCFDIPAFIYRFNFGEWQVEKPSDIWHSSFPKNISIIYPSDTISLWMENDDYDSEIEQFASYRFVKDKGYIDCDVIRFNSWFGRSETIRTIYLDADEKNKKIEFINVITKSTLISKLLKCDPLKGLLIGSFEIAGSSNYYIDVEFEGRKIAEKCRIINGKAHISAKLNSGVYKIYLYEDEEDDTGFGEHSYQLFEKISTELVNPYDLQGNNLVIKTVKKGEKSIFSLSLSKKYIVQNLKRVSEDDYNNYFGKLVVDGIATENNVNVRFSDLEILNYCFISYNDEYEEETEFLYDDNNKTLEFVEVEGLKHSERYRRYESLFEDDYIFVVEFGNLNKNKNSGNIRISNLRSLANESAITLN